MGCFKIDLSVYLNDNRNNIIFFDCMIKLNRYNKEDFLKKKFIAPTTFRRLKRVSTDISNNIIMELNQHFLINLVNIEKIDEYNVFIKKIIENIYYKIDYDHDEYLEKINEFIKDNNFLLPIFKVFKMFLYMNNSILSRNKILEIIHDDYIFCEYFINFFKEDIKIFFDFCFVYKENINKISVENIIKNFSNENYLSGLMTYLLSGKYYSDNNYYMALIFALECEKSLIIFENYKRLNYIRNNISAYYNMLGLYNFAQKYEEKLFEIVQRNEVNQDLKLLFFINYGMTLLMQNEINKLINIFSQEEIFSISNNVGKMYLAIGLYANSDYEKILLFFESFCSKKENGFTRIIYYILSKVTKKNYIFSVKDNSQNINIIFQKVLDIEKKFF